MSTKESVPSPTPRPSLIRLSAGLLGCALIASCATQRPAPQRPALSRPAIEPNPIRTPSAADESDFAEGILAAHNAERGRRHLPPVVLDAMLSRAAQAHADDMARRGKLSHRGGDGSSPFERMERAGSSFRAAAENVAAGYDSGAAVMLGWMRSPGHRRNILGPYAAIGVGHATAPGGVAYWCVTFATPARPDFR